MLSLLLRAVVNAGATMIVAVSSNCGSGCIAPVTSFMLVVITTAFTVVVCWGYSVWCLSAFHCNGFWLQFFISSVINNVILMCGKLMVPLAVSITA